MHGLRTAVVVVLALAVLNLPGTYAQNLTVALFERYLEPLRVQSGVPGLSAAIVQGGRIIWERGFGMADVERSIDARPDTPYPLADLTQTFGAALVLQQVERGSFELSDRIARWTTLVNQPQATVAQVLTHTSTGVHRYDPARFAALTPLVEYYTGQPFRKVLADEILDRLALTDSVPGHDLEDPPAVDRPFFDDDDLQRYAAVIERLAVPYQVDARGRPTRSEYPPRVINAATGLISTVRDLARFDAGLTDGVILGPTLPLLWTPAPAVNAAGRTPGAHGWFVQGYNGNRVMWHFGVAHGAFSSLVLKVPERDLTLILLANSDGLSAPFPLAQGDVLASPYARLFLRVFVG